MRAHVIENGKVVNTIEVESLDSIPGLHLVDAGAGGAIGDDFDGETFTAPIVHADLSALKKRLASEIDADAVAVFAKPTTLRAVYERREAEAIAFRDAGFTGEPGDYIKNFANPAGLTYKAAAELVLQQAAQLRGAQDQLEALRMRKNEVLRAESVEAAEALAAGIKAGIRAIAAAI